MVDPCVKTQKWGQLRCELPFSEIGKALYIGRRRGCGNVGNGTFRCPHFHSRGYPAAGWRYTVAGVW